MSIAYIVSAYKLPLQLARLILRLNDDQVSFYIHVDQKTGDDVYQQMVRELRYLPNITWLSRHKCYWGEFGHVAATLKGIRAICNGQDECDVVVLLTGQDYPIKTNDQIRRFFQDNRGKQFLNYFELPSKIWQDDGLNRIESWHIRLLNQRITFPPVRNGFIKRRFPLGLKPYGGSSYWSLSRECIAYIDQFVNENKSFVRFFKTVDVPDELFFQTIIMNSPFKDTVINDDLRYVDWKDLYAGSPGILGQEDFVQISGSSKLFARKFDMTADQVVLDLIDRQVLGVQQANHR